MIGGAQTRGALERVSSVSRPVESQAQAWDGPTPDVAHRWARTNT